MNQNPSELLLGLPGAERILEGLRDYRENRHTIASCMVRMARPRLGKARLLEASPPLDDGAELNLYQLLSHEGNQAHSRYNALIRELLSFEHALDHRLSQSYPDF
jgi:hypothetical protein